MHIWSVFLSVALLGTSLVQAVDITQVLAQSPTCAQECSLSVLTPAQCQLTDLPNCLCTSTSLQRDLALCVVEKCNLTEQAVVITVFQDDICVGVPQPSRSEEVIRDITIIAAVTFPVVFLRFLSRSMVSSSMWWDDFVVGLATLIMIPMTIIPILNSKHGFGKHFWDVPPGNNLGLRKLYYISQIFYVVVQALAKFSILLLYLRIFLDKRFRLVTQIAIGWMVCHTIAFTIAVSFQCTPIKTVWDITAPGHCFNSQAFVYSAAGFSIVEDFFIMLLPVSQLKALNLDLKKRIALVFMFALGSFACVTSMIRLKYIISYGTSIDLTYDNVDVVIWSVLETFMAIICASLMCLRPLLARLLPSVFQSTHNTNSKHTPNPSWGYMNSKLANKLRSGNHGVELRSEDDEGRRVREIIRVQKTWVTESSEAVNEGDKIELQERNIPAEGRHYV